MVECVMAFLLLVGLLALLPSERNNTKPMI